MRILFLAVPGVRARAYLQTMLHAGFRPDRVLMTAPLATDPRGVDGAADPTPDPALDLAEPVRDTVAAHGLDAEVVDATSLHDPILREAAAASGCDVGIFSGGGIMKPALLEAGPRWIHVHPGRLPDQRGSTCIYWSLLLDQRIHATAFHLEPGLDTGPVLAAGSFEPPRLPLAYDHGVDAWLRAQVLRQALESLRDHPDRPARPQPRDGGQLFYIIHPVLKHLAARVAAGGVPYEETAHVHRAEHP